MDDREEVSTIYVALLEEGTDCWRPVQAVRVDDNLFRIVEQPIPEDEIWEFRPGETVVCDWYPFAEGTHLRAFRKTDN